MTIFLEASLPCCLRPWKFEYKHVYWFGWLWFSIAFLHGVDLSEYMRWANNFESQTGWTSDD